MSASPTEPLGEPREVTDEEAASYRANGWVRLDKLIDEQTAAALLKRLEEHLSQGDARHNLPAFTAMLGLSDDDPVLKAFSHSKAMARVATKLLGKPVRPFYDSMVVKMPVTDEGTETKWHQDLPYYPFDRVGTFNIWIPLVDCPPEKGSMRFITGSHRLGPLGRTLHTDDDTLDLHPWVLDEFEMSPPLHLGIGDATVVDHATIHFAPPNVTDSPRWVYTAMFVPADALYTGAPYHRTDGLGLEVNQPLEHDRFPVLAT